MLFHVNQIADHFINKKEKQDVFHNHNDKEDNQLGNINNRIEEIQEDEK